MDSLNDKKDFDQVRISMRVIGFTPEEVGTIWKLLSSILHLVRFNWLVIVCHPDPPNPRVISNLLSQRTSLW